MKIAIMGAGFVGESLARALTKAGHQVMLSSRNPQSEKMKSLIAEIGDKARTGSIGETLAFSDVVALALPSDSVVKAVRDAGDWSGKTVLDMTQADMLQIQEASGTSVVKIFNSIGAEHYQNPDFNGLSASMLYCGDDESAKAIAAQIASDIGFDPVDAGDSSAGQHLVNLAFVWINLMRYESGRDFAFKLIRK